MSEKVKCTNRRCGWKGYAKDLLRAQNPFEKGEITACPTCRDIESMVSVCDDPDCWNEVTCGTPTPTGYRHTCGKHRPTTE